MKAQIACGAAVLALLAGCTSTPAAPVNPVAAGCEPNCNQGSVVSDAPVASQIDDLQTPCLGLHVFVAESLKNGTSMTALQQEQRDITEAAVDAAGTSIEADLKTMSDIVGTLLLGGVPTNISDLATDERDAETQCYIAGDWVVIPNQ